MGENCGCKWSVPETEEAARAMDGSLKVEYPGTNAECSLKKNKMFYD
jgi:hypothetical protein